MSELFRSDNVVVRRAPSADTRRWVVTFDNYGLGPGFDRPGFGEAYLRDAGVSAIHVLGRGDDWYQYPEMGEAMAAVRSAVARADRVLTYGSSMGGYAALRFADAVGAHAVLALSPQYSIDPAKVPFEKRWLADSHRLVFRPEIEGRMSCACRPVVVFDATGADRRHVARIAAEIEIEAIGLPHVQHPATTFLAEMGLLGPLVLALLAADVDTADLRRRARSLRRNSITYLTGLAAAQPGHRRRTARRLAERAMEAAPENAMAQSCLAIQLSRAGEHEAAIALHERATEGGQRFNHYLSWHAKILVAAGRTDEGLALIEEAISAVSAPAHLHFWRGTVLWRADRPDEAIRAVEQSLVLDPRNRVYRRTLSQYRLERLGPLGGAAFQGLRLFRWRPWASRPRG